MREFDLNIENCTVAHALREVIANAGEITTGVIAKHGFDDILTLHALIHDATDPNLVGTELVLSGTELGAAQIEEAL